jgi:TPR repeat protein
MLTMAFLAAEGISAAPETECEQGKIASMHYNAVAYSAVRGSLQERAKAGDRSAQVALGMTLGGDEGTRWLEQAANQGSIFAVKLLHINPASKAVLTNDVDTRSTLERLAASWAERGAQLGDVDLQNSLGIYYSEGRGVPKNEAAAVTWWKQAAENGSSFAQNSLSKALLDSRGTDRDQIEALKWATLAARKIHGPGFGRIQVFDIPALKASMSTSDVVRAEHLAQQWLSAYEQRESRKHDANERECGRREFDKDVVR